MSNRPTFFRQLPIVVITFLCAASPAFALGGGKFAPSQLKDMPRGPIYAAIAVAVFITLFRAYKLHSERRNRAKIFPKLEMRRRLYAPYSGGNHAEISFGSGSDA